MDLNQFITMNADDKQDLYDAMLHSNELFARVCVPHILTENLTPKQRLAYEDGTLDDDIIVPQFHKEMYKMYDDLLAGKMDNLGFILFRGAAKSTLKKIITLKCICYGIEPLIVYIGESKDQASKDIIYVQDEIESNPIIKLLFGDLKGSLWNKYDSTFNSPNGQETYLCASGMNSRIRGITWKNQRPTLVFCDDFESETNSLTESGRENVRTKINSQLMNMGDVKFKVVFMGTIVHPKAYLPTIRSNTMFQAPRGAFFEKTISESNSLVFDRMSGQIKFQEDPSTFQIGEPAWPTRYSTEYIANRIRYYQDFKDGADFWKVLQELWNVPKDNSKPMFNASMVQPVGENVQFRTFMGITYLEKRDQFGITKIPLYTYDGFDPAAGRQSSHDNSIKCTIGITPDGDIIIIDIFAGKIDIDVQANLAFNSGVKYKVKASGIESFGYQLGLVNLVRKKFKRGKRFNIVEYNRKKSKDDKFREGLVPLINGGRVLYLPGCPNIQLLKKELANYSESNDHDDTIDALYLAIWASKDMKPHKYNVDEKIANMRRTTSPMFMKRKDSGLNWQTI